MALEVRLFDLIMAFSRMLDQVMPALAGHHMRVGFLADRLAAKLNLSQEERQTVFVAAMLHDVGAIPLHSGADDLIFELDFELHARAGHYLLNHCHPLRYIAEPVRCHHMRWSGISQNSFDMRAGCLVSLADRVDIILRSLEKTNSPIEHLFTHLKEGRGGRFEPDAVDAMYDVVQDASFQSCLQQHIMPVVSREDYPELMQAESIAKFSILFGHIIDSCSPFTVTHSTGVAYTATELGRLAGANKTDLDTMFVAGMFHDIGKLGVPPSLLEKPGPLTAEELPGMQHHALLSQRWLDAIPGFEQVSLWGALHHERLNGTGYPHGLSADEISLESRIMAVADVFTAITEDRPYRAGMSIPHALDLLNKMQQKGGLDPNLVRLLSEEVAMFDHRRRTEQEKARKFFIMTKEQCQY